jgi:hypothetical protein
VTEIREVDPRGSIYITYCEGGQKTAHTELTLELRHSRRIYPLYYPRIDPGSLVTDVCRRL